MPADDLLIYFMGRHVDPTRQLNLCVMRFLPLAH